MITRWELVKLALVLIAVSFLNRKWRDRFVEDVVRKMMEE